MSDRSRRAALLQPSSMPGARPARAHSGPSGHARSACWRSSGRCAEAGWLGWERRAAPAADEAQLELIHSARLVRRSSELSLAGGGAIDPDTSVGEPSYRAALHAAGGACEMTSALLAREADGRLLRGAAIGPPRRTGSRDGLLPVQQRRGRRRAGDPRAGRSAACSSSTGTSTTATAPPRRSARRADVLFASIHQSGIYPGTGR